MPRENVLIKSADNVNKIKEILTRKYKWFKEILNDDVVTMLQTCYTERGSVDSRDLVILSYAYNMDKPDIEEDEYKAALRTLVSAFSPRLSFDELDDIIASIRERAEIEREEQLARVDNLDKIAEAHKKEYGMDERYFTLIRYSTKEAIEERYDNIMKELEKPDLNFTSLVKIAKKYHVEKTKIQAYAYNHYKDTIENAHEYLDFLDDFKKEMLDNMNNLDPNGLVDNYKCIIFAMLTQTNATKREEYKSYYDSKVKNIDEKIEVENIHIETDLPQYIIAKDMRAFNFNAQLYSELTLGSEGMIRSIEDDPILEWQYEEKMRVQSSICKGRMEFTLHHSFYNIYNKASRYLETFKDIENQVNPLDGEELSEFKYQIHETFGTQVANTTLLETSDSQVTSKVGISAYEKFFVDGVQLKEKEPLKSFILKEPENSRAIMDLTCTMLMNAVMEGRHHITYVRLKEYNGEFGFDIIPVKFIHNKEAYVESKTNWWSRFWAKFTNLDKKYEKLRVKDQNLINRYDNKVRETMQKYETVFEERKVEDLEFAKKLDDKNKFLLNVKQDLNKTVEYDDVEELGLSDNSISDADLDVSMEENILKK